MAVEVATPLSMMGLAIGMLIPPQYVVAIGFGGLARLMTDAKLGREYFRRKGMLVATGLMTSSLIVEVLGIMARTLWQ